MQQLPGKTDINSCNSVYEQSARRTFYGRTQEEALELLLENFAYYAQVWEKLLDCYDFDVSEPEFTDEFAGYTMGIIVWRYGWWENDPPACREILRRMLAFCEKYRQPDAALRTWLEEKTKH